MAPQINLIDADAYQRTGPPHDKFSWLREHAPVYWHADGGGEGWPGFWAVTRHEDFSEVPEPHAAMQRLMMLNMARRSTPGSVPSSAAGSRRA